MQYSGLTIETKGTREPKTFRSIQNAEFLMSAIVEEIV